MSNLQCEDFRRNPDNSWTLTGSASIKAKAGEFRLPPNSTFKRGQPIMGVAVAEWLHNNCPADSED